MSEGYVVILVLLFGCVPTYNVSTQCLSPFGLREVHWTHQFITQFARFFLQIELTTMIYLTERLLKYQLLKQILAWHFGLVSCNNDIASWDLLWKPWHMPSNNTRCTSIVATMIHVMLCRLRRVWKYQRGNQNPYMFEEQTTQWQKETVQKDKQWSTKHTYQTKDRVTGTPLKHMQGWTQVLRKGGQFMLH